MTADSLDRKERELQLLLAMDSVRDTLDDDTDPQRMFDSIAALLKERLETDAAAIMLVAETSEDVECVAALGLPNDMATDLCREAFQMETPGTIKTSSWAHTVGVRIILDTYPLGGIFLARKSRAFDDDDIALLNLAESQIDSAVMQARMVWKLAQRNRELEAIYQIDRLRDDVPDETTLINSFTTVLQENFKAELCLIILAHADTGEMVVRGMIDKRELPGTALDAIRELSTDIRIPQVIPTPPNVEGLTLLAAPFLVSNVRLGAVVIGRKGTFSIADHRLLYAMTSQMDSAVVHSRVRQQLKQRNQELETIYRIDQIRDREADIDGMMSSVLNELCKVVSSEIGYLMLYDEKSEKHLELKASTLEGQLTSEAYLNVINQFSRQALDSAGLVYSNQIEGPVRSILAIPLILNDKIIGVFGAINSSNARGFNTEDRRLLSAITSQVDTAIFERLERRKMRKVMSRSVDPKVLEYLLQRTDDNVLAGEKVDLSVIFADLRGSTEWAERILPEELVFLLNQFLGRMSEVIFQHEGTLDKFVGDEVIALFGCPVPMKDHALRAVQTALAMQDAHKQLIAEYKAQNREIPPLGIGISSGEVIAGEYGPPFRTDFTAIGRVMNLGARICGAAKSGQVVISPATYQVLREQVEVNHLEPIVLKGISQPVPVFEVLKVK